jgi:hypothetical protein
MNDWRMENCGWILSKTSTPPGQALSQSVQWTSSPDVKQPELEAAQPPLYIAKLQLLAVLSPFPLPYSWHSA